MDAEVTLTMRRPLVTVDWCEQGAIDGSTLPVGTTLTIFFAPGATVVSENPYGEADHEQALRAAAEAPCPHLETDFCDAEYGGCDYFICNRFDHTDQTVLLQCRGDMCRCPSSKVRAEAVTTKEANRAMLRTGPEKAEVLCNIRIGDRVIKEGTVCETACAPYENGSIDICFPWENADGITLEPHQWREATKDA